MTEPEPRATLIVGIGASAGGLAAFKTFLDNTPADTGMAFILVQHLNPEHPSMLVDLLAAHTPMPIAHAEDGALVAANHVYVIPPNATLTIETGVLRVASPAPARETRRPIDTFFLSLAADQGERTASIVLAGVGSDGTQGLQAVKAHGGLTLAQAGFDETALIGMPMSAVATGLVDHVLPVEAMPAQLIEHREHFAEAASWKVAHASAADWPRHLARIATLLRSAIGHDFADYKQNTLIRRVQRRMLALRVESVADYIVELEADPREAELLFRELLIGVTQFFRDPDAFEAVARIVVPALLVDGDTDDVIRVWVAGCATGEEVYSIAILLKETMVGAGTSRKVMIFGTDLDANAISVARAGRYRKPIVGLSPERLERWFVPDDEFFVVAKVIREMCGFSTHSLIKDSPFSRVDLVSCRNVLIYLNSELQHRVMDRLHYALKPAGYLFLGPSESVMRDAGSFVAVDAKQRILQRRENGRPSARELLSVATTIPSSLKMTRLPKDDKHIDRSVRAALQRHSPAFLVINRQHDIVRFSGAEVGQYLEPSAGSASLNLFGLLRKTLRPAVRTAIQNASTRGESVTETELVLGDNGQSRMVTLIVEPIEAGLIVIAFREAVAPDPARTVDLQLSTTPKLTIRNRALGTTNARKCRL